MNDKEYRAWLQKNLDDLNGEIVELTAKLNRKEHYARPQLRIFYNRRRSLKNQRVQILKKLESIPQV